MSAGGRERARERPRQDPASLRGTPDMQRGRPEELPEERRAPGRETSDVPSRGVLYAAAGFFVALFLSGVLVWGLLAYFREAVDGPPVTEMRAREIVPPEPRLEFQPERTRAEVEGAARALLQGYAWADREAGVVRIPVEEAMRLLAEHGWPGEFRAGDVVPPRASMPQRAADTLLPIEPGVWEGEP